MSECQILTPELDHFAMRLKVSAYQQAIPLDGAFELTARCNFNCNMCYVHLQEEQIRAIGQELTNEQWLEIARQAKDMGMLHLTLTGGEVFVRPGFRELYEELSRMGFLLQVYSNGYLIDEKMIEWLKECPPYTLRFTLYGASNETYEKVCGIKNGFDRVSHAIDLVKEAGIPLYMVGMIVKENESDLEAMYQFAKEKNVLFNHSIAVVKPVRGATSPAEEHRLDYQDYAEANDNIKKVSRFYKKTERLLDVCGSYRNAFWLTWNGKMQLCAFMQKPAIDIRAYSVKEAWDKLLRELEEITMPAKCSGCKYEGFCQKCPGMLAAECGSLTEVSDEFCKKAEVLYNTYYDGMEG